MNLENRQQIDYYAQNEQDTGFKCDVCALTFRISSDRNIHILSHFQQINCTICRETLIRLGNIWYSIREHPDHNDYKTEINSNGSDNECTSEPVFVEALKSEPDPIHNEQSETQFEESFTAIGDPNAIGNYNTNHQTEFVRVSNFIEQKPFDIANDVDVDTHLENIPRDTPILDSLESNKGVNDALKSKLKGQCHICMKKIAGSTNLKYHMNLHLGIKPYKCEKCERAFTDKRNLNVHIKTCKGKRIPKQKPRQPRVPVKLISNDPQKSNDIEFQTEPLRIPDFVGQNPFDMDVDSDSQDIQTRDSSQKSVNSNAVSKDQCHICFKKITCPTNLKYHMNLHLGLKPFVCEHCGKAFADKRNLYTHKKIHTRKDVPVNTDDANLAILKTIDPKKFKLTPKQIKSLICPICSKKFTCKGGLNGHMLAHRTPSYQCKLCTITFPTIEKYRTHKSAVHDKTQYNIKDFYDDDSMAERESENTDWVCEYCNMDFKLEINLAKHILKDHDDKKSEHECNICVEKLSSLGDLLMHMRAHPERTQYKCTFDGCEHGFAYKARLSAHLDKHRLISGLITRKTQNDVRESIMQYASIRLSGKMDGAPEEDLICDICFKRYPNRTGLQQHIQTEHNNERIKCLAEGCDKIFKGRHGGMIKHIEIHHPELVRECETCKKVFYSDAKLAEHQLKHNSTGFGSFKCDVCPKEFTFKHRLISHMNSHEKEAKCDICNEKFHSVKGMLAHRERHGKKQTISCRFPGCNATFEDRRLLWTHAEQHPDSERDKSICPYCGKSVSKSHLKDHINIHTGEKPYECSVCKKTFSKYSCLSRHSMIHTGAKPYVCDIDGCSQAYRDAVDLKRHKFSVHKIYTKKHICWICSKVFPERKLLRNHIIKVHDKVDHESLSTVD